MSQPHQANFLDMPPYFYGDLVTRTILLLSVNQQMGVKEIGRLAGAKYSTDLHWKMKKLLGLGVIARTSFKQQQPYFLNPKHPSYDGFRALGRAARTLWAVPENDLPPVPASVLLGCAVPNSPPCTLFGYEAMTRCLLFIRAAGEANLTQLSDMLGFDQNRDSLSSLEPLEQRNLVVRRGPRQATRERPAIINPDFFAYDALCSILDGLLELHSDIRRRVQLMHNHRHDRRLKENWDKPHIKGPRRRS